MNVYNINLFVGNMFLHNFYNNDYVCDIGDVRKYVYKVLEWIIRLKMFHLYITRLIFLLTLSKHSSSEIVFSI